MAWGRASAEGTWRENSFSFLKRGQSKGENETWRRRKCGYDFRPVVLVDQRSTREGHIVDTLSSRPGQLRYELLPQYELIPRPHTPQILKAPH